MIVEISVSAAAQGWRARLLKSDHTLDGFDKLYRTHDDAEQAVRTLFAILFPNHACDGRCRLANAAARPTQFPAKDSFLCFEPLDARSFLPNRVPMTSPEYEALHPADKPAAFTISGVESLGAIEAIQKEIVASLTACETFEFFHGRSLVHFDQALVRPLSRRSLAQLFWNERAVSCAADRAAQLLRVREVMPWWEYRFPRYSPPRCSHGALHGLVARWDDPLWASVYPPTEPRCRCLVVAIPEKKMHNTAEGAGRAIPSNGRLSRGGHSILPFILGARPFPRRRPARPDAGLL